MEEERAPAGSAHRRPAAAGPASDVRRRNLKQEVWAQREGRYYAGLLNANVIQPEVQRTLSISANSRAAEPRDDESAAQHGATSPIVIAATSTAQKVVTTSPPVNGRP